MSAVPQFHELNVSPADVDGLQTYEIVELLLRSGESACDDSRPVVVAHMEADGPGSTSGSRRT